MIHKKIICGLCACNCILRAIFNETGELQRLEGDRESITGGFACIKGLSLAKISGGKSVWWSPLLKQTDGSFVPISLDEAFDRLAWQMNSIKNTGGFSVCFSQRSGRAYDGSFPFNGLFCQSLWFSELLRYWRHLQYVKTTGL